MKAASTVVISIAATTMITIAAINFWFFFLPKLYIELPLSILEFIQKKGQYNMAFPFLGLFIIFLSVAAYYRKRATAQQRKWRKISGAVKIRRTRSAARISAIFPILPYPWKISNRYLWWWRINRLRKRSENPCLPENSKSEPSEQYRLKACLWSCESSCFVRIWPELYHPFTESCRLCRLSDQKRI